MGTVTEYLETLEGPNREALERVVAVAREMAPDAEEGTSYGMPALLYRGKGLLSALETKQHLALYPFSGQILPRLTDELEGFSWAPGTLRFSAGQPVPEELLRTIISLRLSEIDSKPGGKP
jgi:uncharacterized protein YdhG (YjbR/CyaY superfamily)